MSRAEPWRVLMVCTGNICRSPTAEAVLREKAARAGWGGRLAVDSAGTTAYHVGEAPDARSQRHASRRGYDLSGLRARQVTAADFERFDLLLAMDRSHLAALHRLAPASSRASLSLLLDHAPAHRGQEVPDPYYGGDAGFEQVLDLIEAACDGLLTTWGAR